MLPVFRKIRWRLAQDNNLYKYSRYAIGEIVLVVVGILIALQINNWNGIRLERLEEQKILRILHSEFLFNKKELDRNMAKASRLRKNCDSLLHYFRTDAKPEDAWTSNVLSHLTAYSSFDPSQGALGEAISSGKLHILHNDSLRIRLSQWSGYLQDNKEDEMRIMDYGQDHILPLILNYRIPKSGKFEASPNELYGKQEIENTIERHHRAVDYLIQNNYEILHDEIDKILAFLESNIQ